MRLVALQIRAGKVLAPPHLRAWFGRPAVRSRDLQESLYGTSHHGISQYWKNCDCMGDVEAALG